MKAWALRDMCSKIKIQLRLNVFTVWDYLCQATHLSLEGGSVAHRPESLSRSDTFIYPYF